MQVVSEEVAKLVMDFHPVSCENDAIKIDRKRGYRVDEECLVVLRDSVIKLVAECVDADLLDLLMKLLLEFAAQG